MSDLRGLAARQKAAAIIACCVHPGTGKYEPNIKEKLAEEAARRRSSSKNF